MGVDTPLRCGREFSAPSYQSVSPLSSENIVSAKIVFHSEIRERSRHDKLSGRAATLSSLLRMLTDNLSYFKTMKNRLLLLAFAITLGLNINNAEAAAKFSVKISLPGTSYQVNAITKAGVVYAGKRAGSKSTIKIPVNKLAGTSFYLTRSGQLVGPVLAPDGSKGRLVLVKTPKNAKGVKLTALSLTVKSPAATQNYGLLKKVTGTVFDKRYKYTLSSIRSLGLNLQSGSSTRATIRAASSDSDGDSYVDSLDVDVDGDGITNIADASNSTSSIGTRAGGDVDIPYTSMYLSMGQTLNWHINGALSSSEIDATIGGENVFAAALFFSFGEDLRSSIAGGHVVCDSSLVYCRPTSGGTTGTAVYSGFSEGNQSLLGQLWSAIQTDGSEYALESMFGGEVYAASFQPRVGTSSFRGGDNYRVDFTNSSGTVISSKTLTLPPYFLTVPAIRSYNTTTNDSSGDILVDYSDASGPGTNNSNPIVLASGGDFAGKVRFVVSRLQRLAVQPDETGLEYRDYGHLNYGVIISNNSGEFTCGGLYEGLSSTLTEVASAGTGGSFSSQNGAILWPLVDSADDYEPSSATDSTTVGNNTITFTVDLSECLVRNSLAPGTYYVNLIAAGADTGHGSNRAGQRITVTIP